MPETPLNAGGGADHWLAFLYLSGELSPQEARDFEARLDDDLQLQMALADNVLLTTGLVQSQQACRLPGKSRKGPAGPGFWWATTLAAACLLALGLLLHSLQPASVDGWILTQSLQHASTADAASVLALWSQLDEMDEAIESQSQLDSPHETSLIDAFSGEEEAENLEVPDWMLAAMLESGFSAEDSPRPDEEHL